MSGLLEVENPARPAVKVEGPAAGEVCRRTRARAARVEVFHFAQVVQVVQVVEVVEVVQVVERVRLVQTVRPVQLAILARCAARCPG